MKKSLLSQNTALIPVLVVENYKREDDEVTDIVEQRVVLICCNEINPISDAHQNIRHCHGKRSLCHGELSHGYGKRRHEDRSLCHCHGNLCHKDGKASHKDGEHGDDPATHGDGYGKVCDDMPSCSAKFATSP